MACRAAPRLLRAQGMRFRFQRARHAGRRFHIAHVVQLACQLRQRHAGRVAVFAEVFAIGGIEQIGVVARAAMALGQQLAAQAKRARGHGAAHAMHLEKVAFRKRPGARGVGDKTRVDARIAAAQALQGQEEKRFRQPALLLAHAGRHIEHEEHHRVNAGQGPLQQLTETQVFIGKRHRMLLHRAPLDGLLDGTPAVQARTGAVLVPAGTHQLRLGDGTWPTRLQVGQLEVFPQPVEDIVDGKFQQQTDLAAAAGAFLRAIATGLIAVHGTRRAQQVAGLAFALAGAHFQPWRRQPEARVFQQAHRYLHAALPGAADEIRTGDQLGQMGLHRFAHFLVMPQPVARAARKQAVPRLGQAAGRGSGIDGRVHSCASKVVT